MDQDNHGLTNLSNKGTSAGSIIEDQRALQLALELSMLALTTSNEPSASANSSIMTSARIASPLSPTFSFLNNQGSSGLLDNSHFGGNGLYQHSSLLNSSTLDDTFRLAFGGVFVPKKSQNMTECVPVPSSEHVAEIVGRQGCKIKALRAKTNTYIKTPVRGEEPVFIVTGRKEDVAVAKSEILSAADHFTQIRASRKGCSSNGGLGSPMGTGGSISPTYAPAHIPGQITIQVRVPYRLVGLVVGPKGATIKRIQQQTHTYIVTPSRDKNPVFEVTGFPESVQMAKQEIEAHIAIRTGSLPLDTDGTGEDLTASQTELLANLYKSRFSGLEALGLNLNFGLGLGAINSLSSSLSSLGLRGLGSGERGESGGYTVGSSSSGVGSLSSLSSFHGIGNRSGYTGFGTQKDTSPEGSHTLPSFFDYPSLMGVGDHVLEELLDNDSGHGSGSYAGTLGSGSSDGYNGNNTDGNSGSKDRGELLEGENNGSRHNMFSPSFDYPTD